MRCQYLTCCLLTLASTASAFDFETAKSRYLPGEDLAIACLWPDEPDPDASNISLRALLLNADGSRKVVPPSTWINYGRRYGQRACVELKAPVLPGSYQVVATIRKSGQPEREIQRNIVVDALPATKVLQFERVVEVESDWPPDSGIWYEYTLRLGDDRCYPDPSWWPEEKRDIVVLAYDFESGRAGSHTDSYAATAGCIENCIDPVVAHACLAPGLYRQRLRVPQSPGQWQLVFAQRAGPDCEGACLRPSDAGSPGLAYRVIDSTETEPPPAVKDIRYSYDKEGEEPVDEGEPVRGRFYAWVEFEAFNPFLSESLTVSRIDSGEKTLKIEIDRVTPTLYRSKRALSLVEPLDELFE